MAGGKIAEDSQEELRQGAPSLLSSTVNQKSKKSLETGSFDGGDTGAQDNIMNQSMKLLTEKDDLSVNE